MKEIVFNYWREMFGEFISQESDGVLSFNIPGFPEPLMSASFLLTENLPLKSYPHLNVLSEKALPGGFYCHFFEKKQFFQNEIEIMTEPLSEAIKKAEFWSFQKEHYAEAFPFLQRLLPFLALRERHVHVFAGSSQKIKASVIVGQTSSINFFFNAAVASEERKKGVLTSMTNQILAQFPQPQSFYWTQHPWLRLDATKSLHYGVLKPFLPS